MKYILILIIATACLARCSVSPVALNNVPNKNNFSEKQLIEDEVVTGVGVKKIIFRLDDPSVIVNTHIGRGVEELKGLGTYYPSLKRIVISENLDDISNAVLSDIAGTEKIRDMFFNKSKFNFKDKQSFDDYLKLINSEEYGKTLRYWGRIEFYMKHVIPILMPDKKHAELTISGDYNPEDAIEGFTGWTLFKSNPISGRGVTIKIYFQENDKNIQLLLY